MSDLDTYDKLKLPSQCIVCGTTNRKHLAPWDFPDDVQTCWGCWGPAALNVHCVPVPPILLWRASEVTD